MARICASLQALQRLGFRGALDVLLSKRTSTLRRMSDVAAPARPDPTDRSEERIRVGFLAQENLPVPPPVPGGSIARIVYHLAHDLAAGPDGRFDVTVCSLRHPNLPEGKREGVRYLFVGPGADPRRHAAYRQLVRGLRRLDLPHRELQGMPFYAHSYASAGLRCLAELDPDIVHLQNVSQFLPLARRLVPRARLVLQMNCDWLCQLPPRTVRRRLADVDLVLGASDYIADRIRERFPELADRCRTLYNGTDLELLPSRAELPLRLQRLEADLRVRFGIESGPVVLYVGGFAVEKGIVSLLRAFELVLREIPEAMLLLVGAYNRYFQVRSPRGFHTRAEINRLQRSYPGEVERLAARLGERVVLASGAPHDELAAYYALADVYTMPSTGPEPFSLTVPEAMGCGLPVVGTAHGGTVEIVEDGVTGLLVPPGDEKALAGALVRLCGDRTLAAAMGTRARTLVAERFTWPTQATRLAEYYDELVGARACPS
jgi:glycosyltransferase involved in cell wall biosynthesis